MDSVYNNHFYDVILPLCSSCEYGEKVEWICKAPAYICAKKMMGHELYCNRCKMEHMHDSVDKVRNVFRENANEIVLMKNLAFDKVTKNIMIYEGILKYCERTFNKLKDNNIG